MVLCCGLSMRAVKGLRGMVVVRRGRRKGREEGVQGRIVRLVVDGGDVVDVGGRGDGEESGEEGNGEEEKGEEGNGEGYGWALWDAL